MRRRAQWVKLSKLIYFRAQSFPDFRILKIVQYNYIHTTYMVTLWSLSLRKWRQTRIIMYTSMVSQSVVFCVMFCRSLLVIVLSALLWYTASDYPLFLLVIVLSALLRYTASDYSFGIFKDFFKNTWLLYIITDTYIGSRNEWWSF